MEYLWEEEGRKKVHGRVVLRAHATVLGNAGDEFEVFLTDTCLEFSLHEIE